MPRCVRTTNNLPLTHDPINRPIQELDAKMCKKTGQACTGTCHGRDQTTGKCENQTSGLPLYAVGANKVQWYTPTTLAMLLDLVNQYREDKYRLIFGNTAFGKERETGRRVKNTPKHKHFQKFEHQ